MFPTCPQFPFSMPYLGVPGLGLRSRVSKAGNIPKQDIKAISREVSARVPQGLMEQGTPSPHLASLGLAVTHVYLPTGQN